MSAEAILKELEGMGSESYKKMMVKNYGVRESCFGVKIGDMKKIQKRVKKDYQLALDLYDSGNYDAMYLAGLIADDEKMTKKDLRGWVKKVKTGTLAGYTVAWVTAGSRYGYELAMEWIESPKALVATAGWATLGSLAAIKADEELDLKALKGLLKQVEKSIVKADDVVRYWMNMFIISVGCYVVSLTDEVVRIGEKLGPLEADLGDNQCQVPYAPDYIEKVRKRGSLGKKRKTVKC